MDGRRNGIAGKGDDDAVNVLEWTKHLEKLAPVSMACQWDNPGLLAGRGEKEVAKILIALDATDEVAAARTAAVELARWTRGAVAVSGEEDLVTDGHTVATCRGGSPLMEKVTGFGCSLGGVMAVHAASADSFTAALASVLLYNLAGSRAAGAAQAPASFKAAFLDELYRADAMDVSGNHLSLQEV